MMASDLLGLQLDAVLQGGEWLPVHNASAFSRSVEKAGAVFDARDAGRLRRLRYLASRQRGAGYGLRDDRVRRVA